MKTIKSTQHTYIVYRLSRAHLSQTIAAKLCKTSPQMFNQVIRGVKTSGRIQKNIAYLLGFRSWEELENAADRFQEVVYPTPIFSIDIHPFMKREENNVHHG